MGRHLVVLVGMLLMGRSCLADKEFWWMGQEGTFGQGNQVQTRKNLFYKDPICLFRWTAYDAKLFRDKQSSRGLAHHRITRTNKVRYCSTLLSGKAGPCLYVKCKVTLIILGDFIRQGRTEQFNQHFHLLTSWDFQPIKNREMNASLKHVHLYFHFLILAGISSQLKIDMDASLKLVHLYFQIRLLAGISSHGFYI